MARKHALLWLGLTLAAATVSSCKPTCPITACQVRMVHPHGQDEFRGRPFWKRQNPKMGQDLDKVSKEKSRKGHSKSRNKN